MSASAPQGAARVVIALGVTQTLAWASSYYIPAVLAVPMARELAWRRAGCSARSRRRWCCRR